MPEEVALPLARNERKDVSGLFISLAFTGLLLGVAAVALICWGIFPQSPNPSRLSYPLPNYPAPALQGSPHQDMVRFYRAEMRRLNTTGWVDRAQGFVHIPIEVAMRKIAKRGIPGWPSSAATSR